MTGSKDEGEGLERFAEAVADESLVDWERALRETGAPGKTVDGLRALERIAAAHRESARAYDESGSPFHAAAAAPAGDVPEPALFEWGPLRILEKLGEGSYGEVYRAHDPRLRRDVALKLLARRESSARQTEERGFLEEARRLARVRHPNVLTVHGADVHDGRVGLWAELLEGRTLEARLREDGPLGAHEAAVIGADLCRALAAIHAAGIVHGDVKASNVMRESGGAIVLLDFGSGRDVSLDDGSGLVEQPTGTPLSLAPEVLRGAPPSPASDLWALGVLLYRLVSGRYPIPAKTFADLVARHERGESVPLRDVRPDLPADFVQLVERSLEPDSERRFASAGEMERALGAFLAGDIAAADRAAPGRRAADGPGHRTGQDPAPHAPTRRRFLQPALAIAAGLAIAFLGWRALWPTAAPLRVEAALFATTPGTVRPLLSGDEVTVGDRLYLEIETEEPIHVYVLNEDEAGEMYVLFPVDGLETTNPLPPGRHRLPGLWDGVSQDWEVTSAGGRETILVVSSRDPLPPIERELASLPAAEPGALLAYAELDPSALEGLRGVAGMKPSRPDPDDAGGRLARLAESFREAASAGDLWLRDIELVNR
jgi:hypothetical protein